MKVLVDTSIWSLALRRRAPRDAAADELRRLVLAGRAAIVGPVRQEVLSGIPDRVVFERLRDHFQSFPDEPIEGVDYEQAAELFNRCRAKGVQGSNTEFLLCAVAIRAQMPLFTTDRDFERYAKVVPLTLYRPAAAR